MKTETVRLDAQKYFDHARKLLCGQVANRNGIGPLIQDARDVRVGTKARLLSRDESSVNVAGIFQANGIIIATKQWVVELHSHGHANIVDSAAHQNECPE